MLINRRLGTECSVHAPVPAGDSRQSIRSTMRALATLIAVLCTAESFGGLGGDDTLPSILSPIDDSVLSEGGEATVIDLTTVFTVTDVTGDVVQFDSNLGQINVELFEDQAPLTVANFLNYVNDGDYLNTIIHRSVLGFVVQGGGFRNIFDASNRPEEIPSDPPVVNEFGISNTRGTVAMAKLGGNPDSATNEWFFSLADNSENLDNQNGGFTVFARVIGTGMEVVDAIAAVERFDAGLQYGTAFELLPLVNFDNTGPPVSENFVTFSSISVIPIYPDGTGGPSVLSIAVTNSSEGLVAVTLNGSELRLEPSAGQSGEATLVIRSTDSNGNFVEDTFLVTVESATLFSGAVDLGDGWKFLEWLGIYNVNFEPWIFHLYRTTKLIAHTRDGVMSFLCYACINYHRFRGNDLGFTR